MSDETTGTETEETESTETGTEETTEEKFDPDRAMAKIAKANSEAAGLRKRLKELEPLAKKAKELEDANKSETEKLSERAKTAEGTAQEATLRAMRLEVAMDIAPDGMPRKQVRELAKRLIGTTLEELEEDAENLFAELGGERKPSPGGKPRERLRGGREPNDEPVETDPEKLASLVPRDAY